MGKVAVQDVRVAADTAYQDAEKYSDRQDARIEHDGAPRRVKIELPADDTGLFKPFSDNPGFEEWPSDTISRSTYHRGPSASR